MTLTIALCIVILCLSVFCIITFAYYLKARRDRDRWGSIANKRSDTLYEKLGEINDLEKRLKESDACVELKRKELMSLEQRLASATASFKRVSLNLDKLRVYLSVAKTEYEHRKAKHMAVTPMLEGYERIMRETSEDYKGDEAI